MIEKFEWCKGVPEELLPGMEILDAAFGSAAMCF